MQENTISSLCHLLCLRSVPDRSYILDAFPYENESTHGSHTWKIELKSLLVVGVVVFLCVKVRKHIHAIQKPQKAHQQ